jgi:RNA polymerase sigma factor (TIGR02999 family)
MVASEFSHLLDAYRRGDLAAFDRLSTLVYGELKSMAQHWARSSPAMGATTLVNETYLKLLSASELTVEDKQQFMALAATIMRRVIIDEVRRVSAGKRKHVTATWTESRVPDQSEPPVEFLIELDEALSGLGAKDPRLLQVFECRYFAGYSTAETAEATNLSPRTVERLWHDGREYLAAALSPDD